MINMSSFLRKTNTHTSHEKQLKRAKRPSTSIKKILLACSILALPLTAYADRTSELEEQVEDLKRQINALSQEIKNLQDGDSDASEKNAEHIGDLEKSLWSLEERLGQRAIAQAFDGVRLDIGGFIHTTYTTIDAENGTEASFDRQNFELLIGAELDDNWSAFFAGGFLRESDPSLTFANRTDPQFNSRNKNPQIIGWVNYAHGNLLNVRIGRMITPHGIINIEHFPATLLDPEQPQFLRPFSGDTIFPNFATGIQLHGKKYFSSLSYEYAAYATNMSSNADELQVGGRSALGFINDKIALGVNYASGTRATDTDYDMVGVDFKVDIGPFLLKSEFYQTSEDSLDNSIDSDREAFYVQPALRLSSKWIAFTRYDTLDMGDAVGESTEIAVGLNYLPSSNVRLRAIFTTREYEEGALAEADADIFQVSGTFSF